MNFRLVDAGWSKEIDDALAIDHKSVRIICPFIKRRVAERFVRSKLPGTLQVITRFCLRDFSEGVSDIEAIRLLLERGAQVRGVRNLHAKMYLFGGKRAIVTSANLTEAALFKNHEFGFVAEEPAIVVRCSSYFDGIWGRAGEDLSVSRLVGWERQVTNYLIRGSPPSSVIDLGDEGTELGILPETIEPNVNLGTVGQAFVKFFGQTSNRANRSMEILEEVRSSGCHWACTYPKDKRPRGVKDGALIFMGRLVSEPDDILIYGRALGIAYQPGRDDASADDIAQRDWKAIWPHYIRVHHAVFLAGSLNVGVSLYEMMNTLDANSFASTQRNLAAQVGNKDPRRAYMRQAAVELSSMGVEWLNARFERACAENGVLSPAALNSLDWPAIPL